MVKLNLKDHTYYDEEGYNYNSVTKLIKIFEPPFDPEKKIITKIAKRENVDVKTIQDKWDKKRIDAASRGTEIHKILETYIKTNTYLPENQSLINTFNKIKFNGELDQEVILSNKSKLIAGTADVIEKVKTKESFKYNIWDFKTNEKFTFNSPYDNRFSKPLDGLEDCLYNKYALQLSFYAWLLEQESKIIGSLNIVWFESRFSMKIFPVPYMRHEILAILETLNNH